MCIVYYYGIRWSPPPTTNSKEGINEKETGLEGSIDLAGGLLGLGLGWVDVDGLGHRHSHMGGVDGYMGGVICVAGYPIAQTNVQSFGPHRNQKAATKKEPPILCFFKISSSYAFPPVFAC